MPLLSKHCIPCEGGTPPLSHEHVERYLSELKTKWQLVENKRIQREFTFKNFKEAIGFVNKVAVLAERENHHPDIHIFYSRVVIELWTHAVSGLSENDFIVAAKIEHF
jgi:4a-hydroxytetrahydrobiopterin dehydratase